MKYIIFGGAGFVGRYLVRSLLAQGKNVVVCDMQELPESEFSRGRFIKTDVTRPDDLTAVPMTADDIIIHLAARQYHLAVPRAGREAFFFDVNFHGTENVLSTMEAKGCRRLIYFSTDMTYGKPEFLPVTVNHPQHPFGPYGASKKASEDICRQYRAKGFSITIFRPRMILGPGRLGILKKLFRLMEWNLPVPLIGNGENCYQMISVFDCVSAIERAIACGIPNDEYNLGSEQPPKVYDLLHDVIRNVGSHSPIIRTNGALVKACLRLSAKLGIELLYKEQYEIADENYIVDIEHTKQTLGWAPQYSDADMLAQAYEYYEREKRA